MSSCLHALLLSLVCVVLSGSGVLVVGAANLLTNGGFEDGLTGYTISGSAVSWGCNGLQHSGVCHLAVGTFGSESLVSQSVSVVDGHYYTFSFWLQSEGGEGTTDFTVTAQFTGGPVVTVFTTTNPPAGDYIQHSALLQSPATGDVTLTITLVARNDPAFWHVDDLSLTMGGSINGDPVMKGFMGQQFFVHGAPGQVMNLLSTFNMQLNARFVWLAEGESLMPDAQQELRASSQLRHSLRPTSPPPFPGTSAWSHPGNYIGSVGVVLFDDSRVYVAAGEYSAGMAYVTLNDSPLLVSNKPTILGTDRNTTYIQRLSKHELRIRTVNVEYTLVNSDHFLNVRNIHLESGYSQYSQMGGVLGGTADVQFEWSKEREEQQVVKANDLFERTHVDM